MALKDVREVKEENTLNEKLFLLACDKGESSAPFSAPDALVLCTPHSPQPPLAALPLLARGARPAAACALPGAPRPSTP